MPANHTSSRSRILDAALNCISQQGFTGTSMRTLANLVGIQPGSIYHHFSSKQELLSELLFLQQRQRLESVRLACTGKSPPSALAGMATALLIDTRRGVGHLSLRREAHHLKEHEQHTYRLGDELIVHAFQQILVLGAKQGHFCIGHALPLARAIIAIVEDAAQRPDVTAHGVQVMVERLVGRPSIAQVTTPGVH